MFKNFANHPMGTNKIETKPFPQGNDKDFDKECSALQGDLAVVTIENLMQLMSYSGLSGELHVSAPLNAASFIVDNGTLVFAYLKSNSLRIGERLLQKGYVTKENLIECLQLYKDQSSKSKFGALLVEKGFLKKSDLEEAIKEQVRDIFFEVLSWKNGTFSFCTSDSTSNEDILLEERIDHLILTGIVQMDNQG